MKVGTDGVLLGAWVNLSEKKHILDIGTGTGLIALMMAQRSNAIIDALEIETEAYQQALENARNSPWSQQINLINLPLQDFCTSKNYDLIITNPPFFNKSLENPDVKKTNARHDRKLKQDDILIACHKYLSDNGKLALILPVNEGNKFTVKAMEYEFSCNRITYVKPTPGKEVKRLLMEFSRKKKPLTEDYLTIENNKRHDFTEKYIELTKEFYLYF